jgi:hypothetical protein
LNVSADIVTLLVLVPLSRFAGVSLSKIGDGSVNGVGIRYSVTD